MGLIIHLPASMIRVCKYKGDFNGFVPIAIIHEETDREIIFMRYLKYGELPFDKVQTWNISIFGEYYRYLRADEIELLREKGFVYPD